MNLNRSLNFPDKICSFKVDISSFAGLRKILWVLKGYRAGAQDGPQEMERKQATAELLA